MLEEYLFKLNDVELIYLGLLLYFVLIFLKIVCKHFVNKKVHDRPYLVHKICPKCKALNDKNEQSCSECKSLFSDYKSKKVCFNCGHVGYRRKYYLYMEFWITFAIFSIFLPAAIIYAVLYAYRNVCKKCGRMINSSDFP